MLERLKLLGHKCIFVCFVLGFFFLSLFGLGGGVGWLVGGGESYC